MSAFGIGTNTNATDAGVITGKKFKAACDCWFTSEGKTSPRLIKFKGEDGAIQTVTEIRLITCEKKNYAGIPTKEYICEAIIGGIMQEIKLIRFILDDKWIMII